MQYSLKREKLRSRKLTVQVKLCNKDSENIAKMLLVESKILEDPDELMATYDPR